MAPLPEVKDEWQDDDDAGFRKISGRDAELACALPPRLPVAPLIRPPVQQDVAATVPTPAAHPAPPAHDSAPKEGPTDHAAPAAVHASADPTAAAAAPTPVAVHAVEDESIPKHYVEANLPPTPDGSATVNPAAVVDEDPFERFDLKVHTRLDVCDEIGHVPYCGIFQHSNRALPLPLVDHSREAEDWL